MKYFDCFCQWKTFTNVSFPEMIVCYVYNTKMIVAPWWKNLGHNLLTRCVTLCNFVICKMVIVILGGSLGRLDQSGSLKMDKHLFCRWILNATSVQDTLLEDEDIIENKIVTFLHWRILHSSLSLQIGMEAPWQQGACQAIISTMKKNRAVSAHGA